MPSPFAALRTERCGVRAIASESSVARGRPRRHGEHSPIRVDHGD
jgi:hypothetical protein